MSEYVNPQYFCFSGTTDVVGIKVNIDGSPSFVPIDPANTDYANMMVLVAEGKLVIAPAA
jgi:hypothetical protein